jgi:flagellar protein FliS
VTYASRAYNKTRNETASKERLMVQLFEAALRHMRRASLALEQKQLKDAAPALGRASEIVAELLATLDTKQAPELSRNLSEIYLFVSERLLKGSLTRDPAPVREAERAFAPIAEAFAEAVKLVERGEPGAAR